MKISALLILTALAAPLLSTAGPAISLFNGHDLSGWVQRGGKAEYSVEAGEIVGRSVANTPNSFLCTEKTYGDFALEFDFKVEPALNSGVQFRSEVFDHETEFTSSEGKSKIVKIPAGRVHGYQLEIDVDPKKDRWWTAGVYDEARRGWLYPGLSGGEAPAFTAQGRTLSQSDGWNHVRLEAVGHSIKTWLNGEPRAAFTDAVTRRGFIALQVHSIGKDSSHAGAPVRWRNLMLTELEPATEAQVNTLTVSEQAEGWRLLWDGATEAGWRSAREENFPSRGWSMSNGVLSVAPSGGAESRGGGDIITRERFSEFELKFEFKLSAGANSGVKYFVQPQLTAITPTGAPVAIGSSIGLEFQILDDALHPDAKLGRDGNRTIASVYDLIPADTAKKTNPVGQWNSGRIVVTGRRVEHWLNGALVVAYDRDSAAFREAIAQSKYKNIAGFGLWTEGPILLQDHGDAVSFRNLKIRVPATH